MNWREELDLRQLLDKDIPVILADLKALYSKLDAEFHLHGANVPITFGYEEGTLGSYTPANGTNMEQFHFSLLFVGYSVEHPLSRSDRLDLYKHEYAHYMQYNYRIPKEHQWKAGVHGSAWQYCCSLIGAAPTPYYQVGESLLKHNYDKLLRNPMKDPHVQLKDIRAREKSYQDSKNSIIRYAVGDKVTHPSWGSGIVEAVEPLSGSVRLSIRFGERVRKIDQAWLMKSQMTKAGDKKCRT